MLLEALIDDPLTRFIAQVVAIVLVSRLLGLLVRGLGQPLVIAEIVAGIVLGPSLLGMVCPDLASALFARESLGALQLVSQLGLILFMFLIGLELDPKLLHRKGRASVIISHSSIVVPFALGAVLAVYLYPRVSNPTVPFAAFAMFLGAAMSVTAFPVLARILSERRLLRSRVGAMTIACAAVDDVTAWCLLAFVVAAARSRGLSSAAMTSVLALGYILVMFWVVRPLLSRLSARVANREGLSQNLVALVMLLLFASSWATELIGIHALFGAFLLGAMLPKEGGLAHALAEKLEDLVLVVLLPLFFAYSGVRTEIGLLNSPSDWLMCGLIVLVGCVGKFGGSTLAARLSGMSWQESSALGVLMNTRGLIELIVLNIGFDLGVITPRLFAMMVVMALVTTFITTPLLNLIYSQEDLEREVLETQSPGKKQPAVLDPPYTVLVCVANDTSGPGLVSLAGALRDAQTPLAVHALHLAHPSERASFHLTSRSEPEAYGGLRSSLDRARELSLAVKPMSFLSAEPAEDICSVAKVKGADLVLMGWHRPLLSQALLGGTVYHVMKGAESTVAVLLDKGLTELRRVLVPFIGTDHDRAALAIAKRLLQGGVQITLLHVKTPRAADTPFDGEPLLGSDKASDESEGRMTVRVVHDGSPVDVVIDEAHNGYDLVVVGVGKEWGLEQRLLGVVQQERLMRDVPVSLLSVRGRAVFEERAVAQRVTEGASVEAVII